MIELRKMTDKEYLEFRELSISEYAKDLMNGEGQDPETALKNAEGEFCEMLPGGPDTEDQFIMMIIDAQSGKEVGWIWYSYEMDEDEKQVFLCDFLIYENDRRKGYASATLTEMERRAKADGCRAAALFVWDHNEPGAALYRKCGYTPEEQDDGGIRMKKQLKHDPELTMRTVRVLRAVHTDKSALRRCIPGAPHRSRRRWPVQVC